MYRVLWQFIFGMILLGHFVADQCDAKGSVNVRGYHRRDGTYVAPHTRSAPGSGSRSSGSSFSGGWTPPSFSPTIRPRTGYRTAARNRPRTASAGSSLNDENEEPTADTTVEAPKPKKTKVQVAEVDSSDDESKAASRLKRIKLLIAEKKGVISSNMKDSLREVIKKYPRTAAAAEAQRMLDE